MSGELRSAGSVAILCCALFARVARADNAPVCPNGRVIVQGALGEEWLEPVARVCEHFGNIRDSDPSATLLIVPSGDEIEARATLGDGRTAVRRVRSPNELEMTVEALVVLPPRTSAKSEAPTPPAPTAREERPGAAQSAAEPLGAVGVEIGAALLGRLARAPTYLSAGMELHAGIRPGGWILGLSARFEPIQALTQPNPPEFEMSTAGAGFFVARDLVRGRHAGLDCGVSASLVSDTQSTQPGADEIGGTQTDVLLGALVRGRLGGHTWQFAPSAEVDISPSRLRRDSRIDDALPPLPSWSIAVGIGATFEEP